MPTTHRAEPGPRERSPVATACRDLQVGGVLRRVRRLALVLGLFALVAGCSGPSGPAPEVDPGNEAPASDAVPETPPETMTDPAAKARFDALEDRLESASYVAFDSQITSEGLVETDLEGSFELTPEAAIVAFEGVFAGEDAAPTLQAGRVAAGGNGESTFEIERPLHLNQGLLIGFTRMGLLHNLAMLSSGSPPDRTDGTVKAWVEISGVRTGSETEIDGRRAVPLEFALTVDGRTGGTATLYLDAKTGLPVRREQTVAFEAGEMRVVERYGRFIVEP